MQDGYDQTLSGLLRKRAELAQAVEAHRLAWEQSVSALQAIDQAVLVFNPSLTADVLPEKMVAPPFSAGNAPLQRFLLDELRRLGTPLRTLDATTAVMKDRGLDVRDRVVMTLIRKRVGDAFSRLRLAGHVTGAKYGSGSELEWRLTR